MRVLTGIADDPFPDFNPGVAPMDVVLELDGPAENLIVDRAASFLGPLVAAVEPLIDPRASGAVFGRPQQIIGGPHSALRYLYLMRRRSDLSHAAYLDHFFHHHSTYAFHLTGIRAYTQVHLDPEATARLAQAVGLDDIGLDSITDLSIDSLDAFFIGVAPAAAEASTDELRFVDRHRSVSFCATDRPVRPASEH